MSGQRHSLLHERQLLFIDRHGYLEETYWTYSYSPITDADGRVLGVFGQTTDTGTAEILGERRLRTLRDLGGVPSTSTADPADACRLVLAALARNRADIPFCTVYLVQDDDPALVASYGFVSGRAAAPGAGHRPARDGPATRGGVHRPAIAGHRHADAVPRRASTPPAPPATSSRTRR